MNRTAASIVFAALLAPLAALPAQAQFPAEAYSFDLSGEQTTQGIQPGGSVDFSLTFTDASRDSTSGLVGNPAVPNASPYEHQIRFEYTFGAENIQGWYVLKPGILYTKGGDIREVRFTVGVSLLVQTPFMPIEFAAVTDAGGATHRATINVTAYTLGVESFAAQPEDVGGEIKPGSIVDVPIRITNGALLPRGFDIVVTENVCDLQVATSTNNVVGPKQTKSYTISARAPESKPWYFSEICTLGVEVAPSDSPGSVRALSVPLIVNGGYVDPQWVINTVVILLLLVLLFFLLARRKSRVEEEILGKPQKPWLIPVEALYLKALRRKDERAWYVVRHYLMEDEYRSSLMWYHSYKKATKGTRKKEGLVLRQEKSYERWRKAWQKDIAKPLRQADRHEAQLQKKLDRQAKAHHRKQMGKYRKVMAQMKAAQAKQVERAGKKHAKEAAKAAKKGLPAPKRPTVPEPDYPAQPELEPIALATHKWAKKGARFRAKMVRKQGDLEVKFEKADARRLAKVRRKVQRVARKLDDPAFVAEHPLLKAS